MSNSALSQHEEETMDKLFVGLSPGGPGNEERLQVLLEFWNALSCQDGAGETTWSELEEVQTRVADCLSRRPTDLKEAERLTAQAALLLAGDYDL
jgi:hypothetical protein